MPCALNCLAVLQRGCTTSDKQRFWDPVSLHTHRHLEPSLFVTLAILIGALGWLLIILICISLKADGVEHFFFFFLRFYLFIHRDAEREREKEAETQAEGEAGPMQRARRGTRSRVSRSRPGLQAALNRCATRAAQHFFVSFAFHVPFGWNTSYPFSTWNLFYCWALRFFTCFRY